MKSKHSGSQASNLKERWRTLYGTEPPGRISRDLLTRALAYRIQEKALGGLKPSTRRLLTKVAPMPRPPADLVVARTRASNRNGAAARMARHPASGDRPRGRHRVERQAYKSLSQVAPDHRHQVVGAALLRPEGKRQEQTNGTV